LLILSCRDFTQPIEEKTKKLFLYRNNVFKNRHEFDVLHAQYSFWYYIVKKDLCILIFTWTRKNLYTKCTLIKTLRNSRKRENERELGLGKSCEFILTLAFKKIPERGKRETERQTNRKRKT